ncbi:MAG TPA: S41 family peptidase, partial [Pyrinomonadaceae bacterium]|nr:S41 family peptidase [Pyrinomonadaceae bacterium]
ITLTVKDVSGKTRTAELTVDATAPDVGRVLPANWLSFSQTLSQPVPLYLKKLNPNYWFEYLPETKTVYFQFNQIVNDKTESLAAFSERLFKFISENGVEKLVVDMRWNNGGNTFLNPPLQLGLVRNEKVNQNGKLFIIIGRRTFSAAQNFINFCDRNTNAIFVGEPSGSSPNFIGEETPFTLPYSRFSVNISTLYWAGSSPYDFRTWIAPTLYTPPTFEMYKANRDPALEAIANFSMIQ